MATIEELLARLDLGKFVDAFKAQDIDLETASKLSEEDFKELGLTIGARKKLVEALKAGPAAAAPAAPSPLKKPAAAPIAAKPAAAKPAPVAAPVAQPKPAAAVPTGPATINPCSFKWLNKAEQWPNGAPSKFERLRVADGPNPQYATLSCRDEFNYVSVVNLSNGGQFALKPKNARGRRFDADICGDIVVCCGDDEDHVLDIYSLSGRKQTGEYHGPNEGGLSYMTIYTAASGAPQVAGATYNYGKIFFFDIATAARCAKPLVLNDCNPRDMKRDPHNPTCFMAAYADGGLHYIDTRVNKVVKQIHGMARTDTLRLPYSNPNQGIVSAMDEPTRIFDLKMEKFIHTLGNTNYYCSALYKNVAVCHGDGADGKGFFFYDIAGAPELIEEFAHDLRGGHANELDIVNGKVYATCWGSCFTMSA